MKLCIYIFLVLINFNAFSQGSVWITHLPAPDTLQSGKHFTLVFVVNVKNENVDSVKARITLADGWNVLSERKFVSSDNSSARFFYSIFTPTKAIAGYYKVRFDTYIEERLRGFKVLDLRIKEVRNIEILPINSPEFLKEGALYESEFLVQNLGNRSESLTISSPRGILEGQTQNVILLPNTSIVVKLKQIIPLTSQSSWTATSEIVVLTKGKAEPYRGFSSVPVFAAKPPKTDSYRRFPIEAGGTLLSYSLGNNNQNSYQYFVTGNGSIDAKQRHFVDFNIRGPSQRFFPVVGAYDNYSLGYNFKENLKIVAGDYFLTFNNLMEFGRYGRGLLLQGEHGKLSSKIFFQKARFYPFQKESYGADLALNIREGLNITASYFSKTTFDRKEWFKTDMIGLGVKALRTNLNLETELAVNKVFVKYDFAFFNRFFFSRNRISISNNLIYSGKNFFGFYNNSQLMITNIGYYLTKKIGVGINHNYSLINPSLDVLVYNTSPFNNVLMFYSSYDVNSQNRLFLHYTIGQRKDRQEPATYDYHENIGNLNYNLNTKKVRTFSQFRYGYTRNKLAIVNDGLTSRRVYFSSLVQPSFRVVKTVWLGGYFEHQYTSRFSMLNEAEHYFYYGGTINAFYKENFSASLMYRNNYAPDELHQIRSFLDASITLNLKHHRFSLSGGRVFHPNPDLRGQNTLFFSITYALKVNVPVSRIKNVGRVMGKITGLTPDVRRDGILVSVGDKQYLTDHLGGFVFDNLVENKYTMTLKKDYQHAGVISTVKMPLEISVVKDSTSYIEIPLSKTGTVSGSVTLENSVNSKIDLPFMLIKLYNDKASIITDLKPDGEFSFKEVIPGIWKLKAFFSGENTGFLIEMDEREIKVTADKNQTVHFTVKQRERRILFSDQNFQISSKK